MVQNYPWWTKNAQTWDIVRTPSDLPNFDLCPPICFFQRTLYRPKVYKASHSGLLWKSVPVTNCHHGDRNGPPGCNEWIRIGCLLICTSSNCRKWAVHAALQLMGVLLAVTVEEFLRATNTMKSPTNDGQGKPTIIDSNPMLHLIH